MVVVQCAITDRRLYWVSGILATSTSLRPIDRRLATLIGSACSGATSFLAAAFAAWWPVRLGLRMPGNMAVLVLIFASVAGLIGLGLAGS